jgi:CHAD domain-containing protein
MPDDRVTEWTLGLVRNDARAFERARERYLRRPTGKRLHELRTAARRLRSLHDDLRESFPGFHIVHLRSLVALTGEARDAQVQSETLRAALDPRERSAARVLLRELREREREAKKHIAGVLERVRIAVP